MAREPKGRAGAARLARGSLSEQEIVAGALAIVERDGLDSLSMPNLAKHLGAGVMSIYWYFRSKDDLLVAMADRAFEEVLAALPVGSEPDEAPGDDQLTSTFLAVHRELLRAPVYIQLCRANPRLLHPRPSVVPILARWFRSDLTALQQLGFAAPDAIRVHTVLLTYTLGCVLMQHGSAAKGDELTPEAAFALAVEHHDLTELPTLRSLADLGEVVAVNEATFAEGLHLLIEGMRAASPISR